MPVASVPRVLGLTHRLVPPQVLKHILMHLDNNIRHPRAQEEPLRPQHHLLHLHLPVQEEHVQHLHHLLLRRQTCHNWEPHSSMHMMSKRPSRVGVNHT